MLFHTCRLLFDFPFHSIWFLPYFHVPFADNHASRAPLQFSYTDVTARTSRQRHHEPTKSILYSEIVETMAGRFAFPHAYDPHMHREDALTLSRTTSQHNAIHKVNTSQSGIQKVDGSTSRLHSPQPTMRTLINGSYLEKIAPTSPQRRHFVFADPVAFRHVSFKLRDSLSNLP